MKTRKLLTTILAILAFAVNNIQAQTVPSYVPTNGLVGYWGFNGNANDLSGNGNDGTVNGATLTTDRNGNANSAYSFNGVSNFIQCVNPGPVGQTNFSITFWLNTSMVVNNSPNEGVGQIIGYGSETSGNGIAISVNGSAHNAGCSQGITFDNYGGALVKVDNFNNTWNFYTILNDISMGLNVNTQKIYKNGILMTQTCWVSPVSPTTNIIGNFPIRIGKYFGSSWVNPYFLEGKLDDIAIYNRALSQSEISQLYNSKPVQTLCTKTIQPYNVNVGDATHEGSTYAWSIFPAAPNAVISGNGTNTITIDWTNVPDGSYTLQAVETSITGCVSTAVTATINLSATPAPIAQPQTFCNNATVANLVATGTNLQWYANSIGGASLDTIAILTTGTYYVSQTIGTCESVRIPVAVTITAPVIPTFNPIASTCSGTILTALPTTSNNGIAGTWSPALNNNETTTYTFTPNDGQCAATTTQTITITKPLVTSEISFLPPPPFVTIGTQVWMSKNLDVTTYRDGTPIPQVTDPTEWANLTTGAWCYYNNDPANGAIYGKLYNWYAVAGIYDVASLNDPTLRKQFAPIGWHVPNGDEWWTLTSLLGGQSVAGGKMKEIGTNHWNSPNIGATNESGFTALPSGNRVGSFNYLGHINYWWIWSDYGNGSAWYFSIFSDQSVTFNGVTDKIVGLTVRLIKD